MNNSMQTTINLGERQLKTLIKDAVSETIKVEMMKLRAALIPFVSDKEQKDIEQLYDKPSREYGKTHKLKV